MATEKSSQGAALGPELSGPAGGAPLAKADLPDLNEVRGEFLVALCVVDMVSRVLGELSADASERVGSCALALKQGYEMLETVYGRFDDALVDYPGPRGHRLDRNPADDLDENGDPRRSSRHHGKKRGRGNTARVRKSKRLAVAA